MQVFTKAPDAEWHVQWGKRLENKMEKNLFFSPPRFIYLIVRICDCVNRLIYSCIRFFLRNSKKNFQKFKYKI